MDIPRHGVRPPLPVIPFAGYPANFRMAAVVELSHTSGAMDSGTNDPRTVDSEGENDQTGNRVVEADHQ